MISATIIVDTRRQTKKGFPLKIRIFDQINSHRYIPLNIYQIENSKEIIRTSFVVQREFELLKELEYCNKNFLDLEQSINIIKNGIPELNDLDNKILLLEMELNRLKLQQGQTKFKEFFEQFVKDRNSEGKSIFQHKVRINKFFKFLDHSNINKEAFLINDIDYEILYNYKVYCYNNGISDFSFKSYLQGLREVYNEAQKRKSLNIKPDNPFKDIVVNLKQRREVNRDIGIDNLKTYFNLENLGPYKHKEDVHILTRDLIKFQFLIGGHDFIELANLKWKDLNNNRISFYRFKNKSKGGGIKIDNMIHPLALDIIEKYGIKESDRVFSFIPNPEDDIKGYNSYIKLINQRMNSVKKQNSLNFDIRTKYIRYTFRTIGGNLMINQMMLEKIMGHTNKSISMGYQGATPYEIQDAEHLKVIEAVFGQKEIP